MASLKKYDPRLEALVVERRTLFDGECGDLPPDDRRWLAARLHADPAAAASLEYVRAHTGFTRRLTATRADVERLYRAEVDAAAGLDGG